MIIISVLASVCLILITLYFDIFQSLIGAFMTVGVILLMLINAIPGADVLLSDAIGNLIVLGFWVTMTGLYWYMLKDVRLPKMHFALAISVGNYRAAIVHRDNWGYAA